MKNKLSLYLIFLLSFQLLITSCSESDDNEEQSQIEEKEDVKDDDDDMPNENALAEKLSGQVIIKGGTKVEGILPSKKGAITLYPIEPTTGNVALLNEGFELPLFVDSDADVVGAYIEFGVVSNSSGTPVFNSASNHYDVNLAENDPFAKSGKENKLFKNRIEKYSSQSAKISYRVLDVDFSTDITGGEICYFVSVYDADGNISDAQQICMTVIEWGNNSDFTGEWAFTKHELYTPENETIVTLKGAEDCTDDTIFCQNGGSLNFSYCTTVNNESYTFNADGTYELNTDESRAGIDFQAAYDTCESNTLSYDNVRVTTGKWVYNEEDKSIILATYEITSNHS